MNAWMVTTAGRMERIQVPESPLSPPLVRVKVRYAGVGFADVMAVRGQYPLTPRRPFSPGYEFQGEVVARGSAVTGDLPMGTRVVGLLPSLGAYRGFLDLPADRLVPLPVGLDDAVAAALPLNYLTAAALIDRIAKMTKGQSFVIPGAAGGVGTAALELARVRGLRAYGTASVEKHALVASLGGIPLDRRGDWVAQLRGLEPQGVDAAFDAFGGESQRKARATLRRGGLLVSYGFSPAITSGWTSYLSGLAYLAWANVTGVRATVCATPYLSAHDPPWHTSTLATLLSQAAVGTLRPLFRIVPWQEADAVHDEMARGAIRGKVLLDFS